MIDTQRAIVRQNSLAHATNIVLANKSSTDEENTKRIQRVADYLENWIFRPDNQPIKEETINLDIPKPKIKLNLNKKSESE